MRIHVPSEIREIHGDGSIQAVTVENTTTGELSEVPARRSSRSSASTPTSARSRTGPRLARQAADPRQRDDHGDFASPRVLGRRRRGLRGQDHAYLRRFRRGGRRREQRDRTNWGKASRPSTRRIDQPGRHPCSRERRSALGSENPVAEKHAVECLRCGGFRTVSASARSDWIRASAPIAATSAGRFSPS